jgi:hypothetical protein
MDIFVKNIETVNKKYNDIYITYFLYRILIKYKNLLIYVSGRENYNKVLSLLRIPKKYYDLNIIFPLNNYMFYKEKDEVDKTILSLFVDIEVKMKNFNSINEELVKIKKDYDNLLKYINENNTPEKIETITNQFRKKINLQYRNVYVKGLMAT